ncbi:hypothetical protein [Aureimonas psammosilenae]|uniref:hypothetical protein n=1 Tax=Aureimonas psammosilenae TaxID=2495496 RepID=UPI0012607808|nr:hypothetical protein [Aureimonas psammosilenae]
MKMKLALMAVAAMTMTGCVGTDIMSSVSPSVGTSPQFGYPGVERSSLPALAASPVVAAGVAEQRPAAGMPVSVVALQTPTAPVAPHRVYDEAHDPAFKPLLAESRPTNDAQDLPLQANGVLRLPPPAKLDIIDIADTRASLQSED